MSDALDSILKSVPDKKTSKNAADHSTASLRNVEDAARKGVGDNQRMTITIADSIRSQLMSRGCWTDKDDMPDAKRLRAVIRVRFERGGRLLGDPKMIDPLAAARRRPPDAGVYPAGTGFPATVRAVPSAA